MLRLHHARPSDAGTYLCQVSVSPPMSTPVTLLVTEAVTTVHPGGEVFLKAGSRVVLVCEVRGCPYPALVTWYRGRQVQEGTEVFEGHIKAGTISPPTTTSSSPLAPSSHTPITPVPEGGAPTSTPVSTTTPTPTPIGLPIARITLTRPRASAAHSGLYTCTNTCTTPVNLTLHVLIGDEETAAMQHLSGALRLLPAVGGASALLFPLMLSFCHLVS
ncbi:mucin-2 [Procambarus clarkii]|uniref:mucin-2 n=1 Tax=Procambarus clarkii TaxID=6728 RepID=UPI0037439E7A